MSIGTDPIRFKLDTPSGKIELYSQALADAAATWELAPHQHISPIPCYTPDNLFSNHEKALYPLLCSGFHGTGRIHSSFGFLEGLANTPARSAWIHPSDAQARGIETGNVVVISSPYGSIHIEAFVTERIVQGVIALPQGAWHRADMEGDRIDYGGCINTLTGYHPTPIAKGNGDANSIIVEITRFA